MRALIAEIKEEFWDFIEDYNDLVRKRDTRKDIAIKPAVIRGELAFVRPAYLFAERVDNGIKILFGGSVLISGITSTFIGFASLSSLVEVLIKSLPGRITLIVIGLSYLMIALWKTLHLNKSGARK
jgi:hypothetical protein